jgi:hypothetical protein
MTKKDQQTAELMPQPVAISIFKKYQLETVENGFSGKESFICGGSVVNNVRLAEVWSAIYYSLSNTLVLRSRGNLFTTGCLVLSRIDGVKTADEARLIIKAAVSLGANISYLEYSL